MKMKLFANQNLVNSVKTVWKIFIVLILSVLLIMPAPALALNYDSSLKSYVSNVKVELDDVVKSIKELPNLSYENGQKSITVIDNKLQKIHTDAQNNAKKFSNFSSQAQKDLEVKLDELTSRTGQLDKRLRDRLEDPFYIPGFGLDYYPAEQIRYFGVIRDLQRSVKILSSSVVLSNKLSKVSDSLSGKVNLTKRKFGNVKDYAEALRTFNDPDIVKEISELNTMIGNLSQDLSKVS